MPSYNPQLAYQNYFYSPTDTYGGIYQPGEWAQSPIGGGNWNSYLEDPSNRDATFLRYLGQTGGPGQEWGNPNSPKGAWARQQFGNTVTGYEAALATNPLLKYQDYLQGIDLESMRNALTPQQQGLNPGMSSGRMRTIGRAF